MSVRLTVALAGTPNSGKTTLFNQLSGLRHKVANYPGVTVEKRSAIVRHGNFEFEIVDLPGMYGLGAESLDERVARGFCLQQRPQLIICVMDASNLERGLYLAVQWLELGFPTIVDINMVDEAERRGLRIDGERLSQLLGVPVVLTVARKGIGLDHLFEAMAEMAVCRKPPGALAMHLDAPVEDEISRVAEQLAQRDGGRDGQLPRRWLAARLIEGDEALADELDLPREPTDPLVQLAQEGAGRLEQLYGQPPAMIFSERRHDFARHLARDVTAQVSPRRAVVSDRVDRLVTSAWLGLPLFLFATYVMFELAFTLGKPPMEWIEAAVAWLSAAATAWMPDGAPRSLVVDGILGGVGGVIVFLPNILVLFVGIAILEESGYMARGAAIMDRLMSRIGLHGKSFIPLMVGFGCNVPAIMAARTLEHPRDRLVTILVTPMMSCGARLPVYVLFISAFYKRGAPVLFSIYLLGIALAVLSAILFRLTFLRGSRFPFIIEFPPYRWPSPRAVLIHAWDRCWMYLRKAGTVIFLLSVIVWFLSSYPRPPRDSSVSGPESLRYSVAGTLGTLLEPALRPIGLGDWKVGVALLSGFAAKEVVVSSFATMYNVSESAERSAALRAALRADPLWNPVSAYALMVFVLLYVPCLPAMVVLKRETGSWKWVVFQIAYSTTVAYTAALIVFQAGRLLGLLP